MSSSQGADPGITIGIYYPPITNYIIPGPAVFSCSGSTGVGSSSSAVPSSTKASSTSTTLVTSTKASTTTTTSTKASTTTTSSTKAATTSSAPGGCTVTQCKQDPNPSPR